MILSRLSNISGKLSNWGLSLILAISLCCISTQIPAQTPEAGALANPQVRSKNSF